MNKKHLKSQDERQTQMRRAAKENRAQMFTRMDGTGEMLRGLPHASLSCLIAAHDGVRTWQVRDTEVEEGGKVRC